MMHQLHKIKQSRSTAAIKDAIQTADPSLYHRVDKADPIAD